MTREPIYAALFAKLQAIPGIITCSRRLAHWSDCPDDMQPAIYMAQAGEQVETQVKGMPYKWTLSVKVWVYVRVTDNAAPGPVINPILDAIETAFTSSPASGKQTLGGLCDEVIINGQIDTYEGTLGSQEVALVPLVVLVR